MGESHETLGGGVGPKATNPEHVARGTLSAGWLLCDKSPFVLTEERISSFQLLQMKSAGPSSRPCAWGGPGTATVLAAFPLIIRLCFMTPELPARGKNRICPQERTHRASQQ